MRRQNIYESTVQRNRIQKIMFTILSQAILGWENKVHNFEILAILWKFSATSSIQERSKVNYHTYLVK